MDVPFDDRRDAGRRLAARLSDYAGRDVVVIGLPRGGVPVAIEVARSLRVPLDVCVVRKLGLPGHSELAVGAVAGGGVRVLNDDIVAASRLSQRRLDALTRREAKELERRERLYRGDRAPAPVRGRTVIVVDDGLATGATMRVAVAALRARGAAKLVVAAPVAAQETCADFRTLADDLICLLTPEAFGAVGYWYRDFRPTTDDEVRRLLRQARD